MRVENKNRLLEVWLDDSDISIIDKEGYLISNDVELRVEKFDGNEKYIVYKEDKKTKITLQKGIYASQRFGHKFGEGYSMKLSFELNN